MAKYRRKELLEKAKSGATPIAIASLTLSGVNAATNIQRRKQDKKFQREQAEATSRLAEAIEESPEFSKKVKKAAREKKKADIGMKNNSECTQMDDIKSMIQFREKDFSILSSTYKGAALGAGIGAFVNGAKRLALGKGAEKEKKVPLFRPGKWFGESKKPKGEKPKGEQQQNKFLVQPEAAILAGGTVIGAALGLLFGIAKKVGEFVNRKKTVDNRLMQDVMDCLKKAGRKEGKDYTRDPKIANLLKTRVCIVISRRFQEMQIIINTVADPKIKTIANDLVKNIPNISAVSEKVSDKFNELVITTISDSSADAGLVSGIADRFILSGYPVYLVEVG